MRDRRNVRLSAWLLPLTRPYEKGAKLPKTITRIISFPELYSAQSGHRSIDCGSNLKSSKAPNSSGTYHQATSTGAHTKWQLLWSLNWHHLHVRSWDRHLRSLRGIGATQRKRYYNPADNGVKINYQPAMVIRRANAHAVEIPACRRGRTEVEILEN